MKNCSVSFMAFLRSGGPHDVPVNDVFEFARMILHGDEEHRLWLIEAAEVFVAQSVIPPPRGADVIRYRLLPNSTYIDDDENLWVAVSSWGLFPLGQTIAQNFAAHFGHPPRTAL